MDQTWGLEKGTLWAVEWGRPSAQELVLSLGSAWGICSGMPLAFEKELVLALSTVLVMVQQ